MARTPIDIHEQDPTGEVKPNKQTMSYLDNIERQSGAASKVIFKALEAALAALVANLIFTLKEKASKKQKLGSAFALATIAAVRIPKRPPLPSVADAQKVLSQHMPADSSPEATTVNQATQQVQTARDPQAIENFQKRKTSQVSAKISQEVTDLTDSLRRVNGLKNEVARRAA